MRFNQFANVYIKIIPALGFLLFCIAVLIYTYPRSNLKITTNPSYWGAFGDFIGGVLNPIFAIFTLIGLVLTIRLQMEILEVQKKELVATREELKKSAEALEIQNKTMLSQNFEGTFFRMLEKQAELLNRIEFPPGSGAFGSKAVRYILDRAKNKTLEGNNFLSAYEGIYKQNKSSMGPYFRNLYHTLKLIDKNQHLADNEKYDYSSLARAQLSSDEITLAFYNCLTEPGKGLKELVIKYRMLKHIDTSRLASANLIDDNTFYPPETFLARD